MNAKVQDCREVRNDDYAIREQVGRLVMRWFPRQARAERGGEMLEGAMLEASCGSTRVFVFEAASLGFAGLRERASAGAPVSTGSLVRGFPEGRRDLGGPRPDRAASPPAPNALALLAPGVLASTARAGAADRRGPRLLGAGVQAGGGSVGIVMLGCGVERWLGPLEGPGFPLWCVFAWYAMPFTGFVLMVVGRSPPSRALRRRSWMLPLSAIVLLAVPIDAFGILPGVLIGLSALTIAGLLRIVFDPCLWIATALVWTGTGVYLTAMSAAQARGQAQLTYIAILLTGAAPAAIALTHAQVQRRRA